MALSTGRMHLSPVGISKRCFLLSLALCALLLLLIPTLQTPPRQGELPQPRPRDSPTRAGRGYQPHSNRHDAEHKGAINAKDFRITQSPPPGAGLQEQRVLGRDMAHARSPGSHSREPLELKDIFIAVKTTRKYHKTRLQLLFQTWVSEAKEQVGGLGTFVILSRQHILQTPLTW